MQKLQKQLKSKRKILTSRFLKLSSKFGIRGVKNGNKRDNERNS